MGLFGGGSYTNPADSAMPYLNQIPGTVTPYYQPYIDAGSQALGTLQDQNQQLLGNLPGLQSQYTQDMTNPGQTLSQIGSGYTQSPGYQWQLSQGEDAITNAAAAGGMLGTPQQQQYAGTLATNLANQNYNDYMKGAMSLYNTGVHGAQGLYDTGYHGTQDINHMGYSASNTLANTLAQTLMQQANLAYAGQANQNQHNGTRNAGILSGLGHGIMSFMGSGSGSGSGGNWGKDLIDAAGVALMFM